MPTKIFVGNLNEASRSADLKSLFEKFGNVTECDILKNFGFVHMESEEDAKAAIEALNSYMFDGNRMNVEISHGKSKRRDGGQRGGRGVRGGFRGSFHGRESFGTDQVGYTGNSFSGVGAGGFGGTGGGSAGFRDGYRSMRGSARYEPYSVNKNGFGAVRERFDTGYAVGTPNMRDPYQRPPPEYYGAVRDDGFRGGGSCGMRRDDRGYRNGAPAVMNNFVASPGMGYVGNQMMDGRY